MLLADMLCLTHKISDRLDDRAVYVGTVRYHRDDYNTITKTEVINDYARVNKAFVAKYGAGLKLRNARPEPVKKK